MCGPLAAGIASFAVSAVSTVANYAAQRNEAKAVEESAIAAHKLEQNQLSKRQMQEQDALVQKQRMQAIEEAQAKAETVQSAASGGISGISLDNLVADVSRRAATNRQTEEINTRNIVGQLAMEKKGVTAQAKSRINSSPAPSPISLVAGLGGAALSGFNSYSRQNKLMGA